LTEASVAELELVINSPGFPLSFTDTIVAGMQSAAGVDIGVDTNSVEVGTVDGSSFFKKSQDDDEIVMARSSLIVPGMQQDGGGASADPTSPDTMAPTADAGLNAEAGAVAGAGAHSRMSPGEGKDSGDGEPGTACSIDSECASGACAFNSRLTVPDGVCTHYGNAGGDAPAGDELRMRSKLDAWKIQAAPTHSFRHEVAAAATGLLLLVAAVVVVRRRSAHRAEGPGKVVQAACTSNGVTRTPAAVDSLSAL
jgi:hypothetical protein